MVLLLKSGVLLQSPQGIRVPVLRFKHDHRFHRSQAALPGNAELSREVVVDMGDAFAGERCHSAVFLRWFLPYTVQSVPVFPASVYHTISKNATRVGKYKLPFAKKNCIKDGKNR